MSWGWPLQIWGLEEPKWDREVSSVCGERVARKGIRKRKQRLRRWPTMGKFVLQRGTLWNEIERLKDKGNFLTEDQILQLLLGICRGLEVIHARGYAHRSVGGPRVLMGQKGRASPKGMRSLLSS